MFEHFCLGKKKIHLYHLTKNRGLIHKGDYECDMTRYVAITK